jgi:hypothetical protein
MKKGTHPNSLGNLVPGQRKGQRTRITKEFVEKLTDYLTTNFDGFLADIASLSPRDRVAAYLKMAEMVIPKKQEMAFETNEQIDWKINPVTVRELLPLAEPTPPVVDIIHVDIPNTQPNNNTSDEEIF